MSDFGFPETEVLDKLDEIDISHIREQGFAKERYPVSLIKTYRYYCEKAGRKTDPETERKITDIGWNVFRRVPECVDGAEQVLDILKEHYLLILVTLGDPEIQSHKIEQSGLKTYFSAIHILNYKSVDEYQQILKGHRLRREETWIIGNSVRSDLNPGLRLGLNCILIPSTTWKFEEEEPVSNQYIQVSSLHEILHYLLR